MKYNFKELETERLLLKKPKINDFIKAYEYNLALLEDDAHPIYEKYEVETIKSWFPESDSEYFKSRVEKNIYEWIIHTKFDNDIVGVITAEKTDICKNKNEFEISIMFRPEHWGNEYAKESLTSIINFLFEIGCNRIYYRFKEYNLKSKRVVEKLELKFLKKQKSDMRKEIGSDEFVDDYIFCTDKSYINKKYDNHKIWRL